MSGRTARVGVMFVAAFASGGGGGAAWASFFRTLAINLAVAAVAQKFLEPDASQEGGSEQDAMIKSNIATRKIVYGRSMISGPIVYAENNPLPAGDVLDLIIVLTGHPIDGFEGFWADDEMILDYGSHSNTAPRGSKFSQRVEVHGVTGQESGADSTVVSKTGPSWTEEHKLTGCSYMLVKLKYIDDNADEAFGSGIPNFKALIRGKQVYDPRDSTISWNPNSAICLRDYLMDSTYGIVQEADEIDNEEFINSSNICDEVVESTEPVLIEKVWDIPSYNDKLVEDNADDIDESYQEGYYTLDHAASSHAVVKTSTPHGLHINSWIEISGVTDGDFDLTLNGFYPGDPDEIDASSVVLTGVLRILDDKTFLIETSNPPSGILENPGGEITIFERRYTTNTYLDCASTPLTLLESLTEPMAGTLVYSSGVYVPYTGAWEEPVIETDGEGNLIGDIIQEDDLAQGGVTINANVSRADRFNILKGTMRDSTQEWKPNTFPNVDPRLEDSPETNPYVEEDGEVIIKDIELSGIISPYAAQRISRIMLEKSRRSVTAEVNCKISCYRFRVGQRVKLKLERYGWASGEFFEGKPFRIVGFSLNEDFTITLELQEDDENVYKWNRGFAFPSQPYSGTNIRDSRKTANPKNVVATPSFNTLEGKAINPVIDVEWDDPEQNSLINYYQVLYRKYDPFEPEDNQPKSWKMWTQPNLGENTATINDIEKFEPVNLEEETVMYQVMVRSVNRYGIRSFGVRKIVEIGNAYDSPPEAPTIENIEGEGTSGVITGNVLINSEHPLNSLHIELLDTDQTHIKTLKTGLDPNTVSGDTLDFEITVPRRTNLRETKYVRARVVNISDIKSNWSPALGVVPDNTIIITGISGTSAQCSITEPGGSCNATTTLSVSYEGGPTNLSFQWNKTGGVGDVDGTTEGNTATDPQFDIGYIHSPTFVEEGWEELQGTYRIRITDEDTGDTTEETTLVTFTYFDAYS